MKATPPSKVLKSGAEDFIAGTKERNKPGKKPVEEPHKMKCFNLPVSMIEKLEEIAAKKVGGNLSLYARQVFEEVIEEESKKK